MCNVKPILKDLVLEQTNNIIEVPFDAIPNRASPQTYVKSFKINPTAVIAVSLLDAILDMRGDGYVSFTISKHNHETMKDSGSSPDCISVEYSANVYNLYLGDDLLTVLDIKRPTSEIQLQVIDSNLVISYHNRKSGIVSEVVALDFDGELYLNISTNIPYKAKIKIS